MLLDEFKLALRERAMSEMTLKCYHGDLTDFMSECPDILNATKEHVQAFIDKIKLNYKSTTVARKIAALRTFFKWASRTKGITDPFFGEKYQMDKPTVAPPRTLSRDEVQNVLENIRSHRDDLAVRDRTMILMMVSCGLRVSELVEIRNRDIDLLSRIVTIRHKGHGTEHCRDRLVDISALVNDIMLYQAAKEHHSRMLGRVDDPPDDYFFKNKAGESMSTRSVRRKLSRYSESLHGVSPRILRHTFATQQLDNGVSEDEVRNRLGLLTHSTTMRYRNRNRNRNAPVQSMPSEVTAVETTQERWPIRQDITVLPPLHQLPIAELPPQRQSLVAV